LKSFLGSVKRKDLVDSLERAYKNIKMRRDIYVHRGRIFATMHKDKFYTPLEVKENMSWSQLNSNTNWIETTVKLSEDIIETEKLVNELHEILIREYGDFISDKKIQIDYGDNK